MIYVFWTGSVEGRTGFFVQSQCHGKHHCTAVLKDLLELSSSIRESNRNRFR